MNSTTTNPDTLSPPLIGISSCLLGEDVRHDGTNKLNAFIVQSLGTYMDFHTVCPEVEIGMGTPRQPIQLVNENNNIKAVGTNDPDLDVTDQLLTFGKHKASQLGLFSGYIFKSQSPSCGLTDTLIEKNGNSENGSGLFASAIIRAHPHLPVIDETTLEKVSSRISFFERVFLLSRWHRLTANNCTLPALKQFHDSYKIQLSACHPELYAKLSRFLGILHEPLSGDAAEAYLHSALTMLEAEPTTNRLQSMLYMAVLNLEDKTSGNEQVDLNHLLEQKNLPASETLRFIRALADKYDIDTLSSQTILNLFPGELELYLDIQ